MWNNGVFAERRRRADSVLNGGYDLDRVELPEHVCHNPSLQRCRQGEAAKGVDIGSAPARASLRVMLANMLDSWGNPTIQLLGEHE